MTNPREIIRSTFFQPFQSADRSNIGVELEFPLLNLAEKPVDSAVAAGLIDHMLACGFHVDETDDSGRPAFIINRDGDCLSFDNSYNNFEFSMEYSGSLVTLHDRFKQLYEAVQQYLRPHGHTLCGMGTNPLKQVITPSPVRYPVYLVIHEFLNTQLGGKYHSYPVFPAYLSSVQTHLDVSLDQLPQTVSLFAALDFARAYLFSNSLPFSDAAGFEETVCFRDYLWERSAFGSLDDLVGKVDGSFQTLDDIEDRILNKSMFYHRRGERFSLISPEPVRDYFRKEENACDMETYLSFKNIEVTQRGTLEIRGDCAQPVHDAFAPPAFNLGILCGRQEAESLLHEFFAQLPEELSQSPSRNTLLRDAVIYHYRLPVPEEAVRALLCGLVQLAHDRLSDRGKGEEALLKPLFSRAERITCPARETREALTGGVSLARVIKDFATLG